MTPASVLPLPSRKTFPRTARLLKHAEFDAVYQQGKRHFSASMTVFFLPRPESSGPPRIGFTVGRAMGGAVERNRIKRRVRAAVREHLVELTAVADVVINPKQSAATVAIGRLSEEVQRAFAAVNANSGDTARPRVARSRS